MKRICAHWTAGNLTATESDKKHYHVIVDNIGVHDHTNSGGMLPPEANNNCKIGRYVAHCKLGNTGTIGIAIAGYRNHPEESVLPDEKTFDLFFETIADYCEQYDIEVTPQTVYTHAEYDRRLSDFHRDGKIDFNYIPYYDIIIIGISNCGDFIREKILEIIKSRSIRRRKEKKMGLFDKVREIVFKIKDEQIFDIVERVENEFKDLKGSEKKQKAVEFINELIDIPVINESTEEKIISYLFDKSIDLTVFALNKYVWKKS